jgi:hypothetical protein
MEKELKEFDPADGLDAAQVMISKVLKQINNEERLIIATGEVSRRLQHRVKEAGHGQAAASG